MFNLRLLYNYKFLTFTSFFLFTMFLPVIFSSSFALTLLSKMGVLIIFSVAYNMLLGQSGLLSFGHAIYFGLAGYATIHILNGINSNFLLNFPVSLLPLLGALVGLFLGFFIGYLSTRRIGTAFALISLGFCELITALTLIFVIFFNGEDGIEADRVTGENLLGISYGPQIEVYYLIIIWMFICLILMYVLTKTPFGKMCNAVRDNAQRAEFIGYDVRKIRLLAFSLSATFAGAAGSLHAINYEHIGFETVSLVQSGNVLFMAYIGGIGNFFGPIFGAISLTYLDAMLSDITEAWILYLGIIFVLIVAFAPEGISGIIFMHSPIIRINPRLMYKLSRPYLLLFMSMIVLTVGFTSLIELIHSLKSTNNSVIIYWIKVNNKNLLVWLISLLIFLIGFYLCKRSFKITKEKWEDILNQIKLSLKK